MRNRGGCLIATVGIVVGIAGIFAWQLALDSPGWSLSAFFRVAGLIAMVAGAGGTLFGFLRMAKR
jgi:hypothetical protein